MPNGNISYDQGIFTVDVENGLLTVNEALAEYGIGGINND